MTKSMEDSPASKRSKGPFDSGKGVRIQGGKVYDSKFGITCHWCRQKTLEDHVTCTSLDCGGGKKLPVTFCKMCLKNRHGEDHEIVRATGSWVCPCCRGGCGKGCKNCCNCGPCRKKMGFEPTFQVLAAAKAAGFNNVHDFLIFQATGESKEQIEARKDKYIWCTQTLDTTLLKHTTSEQKSSHQEASSSDSEQSDDSIIQWRMSEGTVFEDDPSQKLSRKRRIIQALGL